MKIGVALSGSGPGAQAAYAFADELMRCSVKIDLLSVTSLAAVSCMLWAKGLEPEEIHELMTLLEASHTPACGLRQIEKMGVFSPGAGCPLAVNSADIATGVTVIHTDQFHSDAWNLKTCPLAGNERAALIAAVSPYRDSPLLELDGMRLCDFSVRYGCPFFPLRMNAAEKILSVSFAGGASPAQIASSSLASLTGKNADLHYTVHLDDPEDPAGQIRNFVQENIVQIYHKMLF